MSGRERRFSRKPKTEGKKDLGHKYEKALRRGALPLKEKVSIEEQAERFRKAVQRNIEITRAVTELLRKLGSPRSRFGDYNAFAYQLGKLARRYSKKSLKMAVLNVAEAESAIRWQNLVDLWEFKGLDRDILIVVCREVFGVEVKSAKPG